jgi:hypothetical protein
LLLLLLLLLLRVGLASGFVEAALVVSDGCAVKKARAKLLPRSAGSERATRPRRKKNTPPQPPSNPFWSDAKVRVTAAAATDGQ